MKGLTATKFWSGHKGAIRRQASCTLSLTSDLLKWEVFIAISSPVKDVLLGELRGGMLSSSSAKIFESSE
jgi:hypothetical protein